VLIAMAVAQLPVVSQAPPAPLTTRPQRPTDIANAFKMDNRYCLRHATDLVTMIHR